MSIRDAMIRIKSEELKVTKAQEELAQVIVWVSGEERTASPLCYHDLVDRLHMIGNLLSSVTGHNPDNMIMHARTLMPTHRG